MAESRRKRCREEEEEKGVEEMGKHFRGVTPEVEELIHMLDEAEEERNVAEEDILCGVMKILEEEISSCCSGENGKGGGDVEARCCEEEMSYLLTASDDELGIPPSPSLIDSPLYEHPPQNPYQEEVSWHFDENTPNWLVPVAEYAFDEYEETDFCGGLFELCEGEQAIIPCRQETTCAM